MERSIRNHNQSRSVAHSQTSPIFSPIASQFTWGISLADDALCRSGSVGLDHGFVRVAGSILIPKNLAAQFVGLDESASDCSLSHSDDSDDVVGLLLDWYVGFVGSAWQLPHLVG